MRTARYFGLEMFRAKPLSEHLAYIHQQVEGLLASDLSYDEQMLVELQHLEMALPAYINRARKMERAAEPDPLLPRWMRSP